MLAHLHQSSIILKSQIYKIANNPPFDFLAIGKPAKKFSRTPCHFAILERKACTLSSCGVSRKYYITTVTGNLGDETVVNYYLICYA